MGLHERAEEVLAVADPRGVAAVGIADRSHARVGGRAIHLHVVLIQQEFPGSSRYPCPTSNYSPHSG